MLEKLSECYVVLHRIKVKLGNHVKVSIIESFMPDERTSPFAMDFTWNTARFKLDIQADFR
ncbi:hypothetical protein EMCG_04567 [[Emmonsia] crescens]|uniref:Uncharacterized protein n=1 Tax=[Emmonsia] crescens TaxID=73230 RepID=A0A0G2HRU8_9EURO|nr:hypothetical protein EMCG_04567 [Emmonsia crescens UAMH 3008]